MLKMVAITNLDLTNPMLAVLVHSLADELHAKGMQPYLAQVPKSRLTELILGPVMQSDVDQILAMRQVISLQNPAKEWEFSETPILVLERDL